MEKIIKDKLIEMQKNGTIITIGFANFCTQVFKIDSNLQDALWTIGMELDQEDDDYYLVNINDSFSAEPLDIYDLDDGIYIG